MLKKRLIFTLLYKNGHFMLSRNFRLQKVGDINWLMKNYQFSAISDVIDELILINTDPDESKLEDFCEALESLVSHCMIPVAAGGQIRSPETAAKLLASGADKLVLNTPCFDQPELIEELVARYGSQCIVAAVDWKNSDHPEVFSHNATLSQGELGAHLSRLQSLSVGEVYLNSIHRDGTGQGYDFEALNALPSDWNIPLIYAGGAGQSSHLQLALEHPAVDAAATANLFNFVAGGLAQARQQLLHAGIPLARFETALQELADIA